MSWLIFTSTTQSYKPWPQFRCSSTYTSTNVHRYALNRHEIEWNFCMNDSLEDRTRFENACLFKSERRWKKESNRKCTPTSPQWNTNFIKSEWFLLYLLNFLVDLIIKINSIPFAIDPQHFTQMCQLDRIYIYVYIPNIVLVYSVVRIKLFNFQRLVNKET